MQPPDDPFRTPMQIDHAANAREAARWRRHAWLRIAGGVLALAIVAVIWWATGLIYVGIGIFIGVVAIFRGVADLTRSPYA